MTFPNPFPLVLQGAVSITNSSVTYSTVPDLPLSLLQVTLNGGPTGLFQTTCNASTGTLTGAFGSQNGVMATSNAALTVSGCTTTTKPGPPAVSRRPCQAQG